MEKIVAMGVWKVLIIGVVTWPWVGWAQRSEIYKQEIRALFKEGKAYAEKGRYQNAMMRFFAALDLLRRLKARKEASEDKKRLEASEINFFYFLGKMYALDKQQEEAIGYYRRCAGYMPRIQATKLCEKELKALGVESSKAAPSPRGEEEKASGVEDSSPPLPPIQNSSQGGKKPTTLPQNRAKPLEGPRRVAPETKLSPRLKLLTPVNSPEKKPSSLEKGAKPKPTSWDPAVGRSLVVVGVLTVLGGAAMFVMREPLADKYRKQLGIGPSSTPILNQMYRNANALAVGGGVSLGVAALASGLASFAFVKARPAGLPPTTKAEIHVQGGGTTLFERW